MSFMSLFSSTFFFVLTILSSTHIAFGIFLFTFSSLCLSYSLRSCTHVPACVNVSVQCHVVLIRSLSLSPSACTMYMYFTCISVTHTHTLSTFLFLSLSLSACTMYLYFTSISVTHTHMSCLWEGGSERGGSPQNSP